MASRGFPSMTALLALLAIAGYQNRDKIAHAWHETGGAQPGAGPGKTVSAACSTSLGYGGELPAGS